MRKFDFWSDGNIEEHENGKYLLREDVIENIKKYTKKELLKILNKHK